jgi:type II pantothenate kinase
MCALSWPAQDPGAYGQLGLSDLFEMREECLREFGFSDVYRLDKEAENDVALQVRGFCI